MEEINLVRSTKTDNAPKSEYVLKVTDLKQYFPIKSGLVQHVVGYVKAVDGITFKIKRGNHHGAWLVSPVVEKTTVGKTILRLNERTSGEVLFNDIDIFGLNHKELTAMRPKMQIIFQDPYSSLSPRLPVSEIIGEAVREHHLTMKDQFDGYVENIMKICGLQPYHKDRYPHEFSGGQRQRIGIARALALLPEFHRLR